MPAARRPEPPARARLYRLGALLVTAAAVAAVLVAILTAGSTSQLQPGKPVPGARQTLTLFAGIPQFPKQPGWKPIPATVSASSSADTPALLLMAMRSR